MTDAKDMKPSLTQMMKTLGGTLADGEWSFGGLTYPEDADPADVLEEHNTGKSSCGKCGKPMVWVRTKNNRPMPYDPTGLPHHATCIFANQFRKTRK
jgi:hypothetical protein